MVAWNANMWTFVGGCCDVIYFPSVQDVLLGWETVALS